MSEPAIPFYVAGALITVYVVAATWRSRDVEDLVSAKRRQSRLRTSPLERRIIHWWRARRLSKSL